jgi:hypothetical protein
MMSLEISRRPTQATPRQNPPRNYFDTSLQNASPNTQDAFRLLEKDPDGQRLMRTLRQQQITIREEGSTLGGGGVEFRWDPEIPQILVDRSFTPNQLLMFLAHEGTHAYLAYHDPDETRLSREERYAAKGNSQHEEETAQRVALGVLQRAGIKPDQRLFPGWDSFLRNYQDLPPCDNSERVLRERGFLLDNTQSSRVCPANSPRPTRQTQPKK